MAGALNQTFTCEGNAHVVATGDVIKCVIIIVIMVFIIAGNMCCLIVFNSRESRAYFMDRFRYAMTSLCLSDLCTGVLMCPSTIYPALKHCWPFGEVFCKFEALLIASLYHESTMAMVVIAIDRYCIIHHPGYRVIMTSRKFLLIIIASWFAVFLTYVVVIFVGDQFYFDEIGINCEPYFQNPDVALSVLSFFYFAPAIVFVFCYGSIYRTARKRSQVLQTYSNTADKSSQRRMNANIRTSKYLAAITAGFVFAMTPWTLSTVLIVAADVTLPHDVDFFVTWLALSNCFWNTVIYGLMNRNFRMAAMNLACGKWVKAEQCVIDEHKTDDVTHDMCDKMLGTDDDVIDNDILTTEVISTSPFLSHVTSRNSSPCLSRRHSSCSVPVSSRHSSPCLVPVSSKTSSTCFVPVMLQNSSRHADEVQNVDCIKNDVLVTHM